MLLVGVNLLWFWAGTVIGSLVGWVACAALVRNSLELDNMHYRHRGDVLEAGLQSIANSTCCSGCQEAALVAESTLEEVNPKWL
jgi:hypothetical protein